MLWAGLPRGSCNQQGGTNFWEQQVRYDSVSLWYYGAALAITRSFQLNDGGGVSFIPVQAVGVWFWLARDRRSAGGSQCDTVGQELGVRA